MRIACVGGGPAGLYFAILARQLGDHEVTVYERFPEGRTYGWGVVFWDDLLEQLEAHDAPSAQEVRETAFRWVDQVVDVRGREPVRVPSHGYSMARQALLGILARRARALGVTIRYEHPVRDPTDVGAVDLLVAGDGVNSALRGQHQDAHGTVVTRRRNKYVWLGTTRVFDSFTFPFVETAGGWVWAHAYGYDPTGSTFIVEMSPETWTALSFDRSGTDATMRRLEDLFAPQLEGHRLRPQTGTEGTTPWLQFQQVTNACWHHGNVALMGDAAHTTHFTIGSGTRLALEDAMALAHALGAHPALGPALAAYGQRRAADLREVQRGARYSAQWFEDVPRYITQGGDRFARAMIARRSPLLARLPVNTYLGLSDAAAAVPVLSRPAMRLVEGLQGLSRRSQP